MNIMRCPKISKMTQVVTVGFAVTPDSCNENLKCPISDFGSRGDSGFVQENLKKPGNL